MAEGRQQVEVDRFLCAWVEEVFAHLSSGAVHLDGSFSMPRAVHVFGEYVDEVKHQIAFRMGELAQTGLGGEEVEAGVEQQVDALSDLSLLLLQRLADVYDIPSMLLDVTDGYVHT